MTEALASWGYDIALHYRNDLAGAEATAALAAEQGARTHCVQADLGDARACEDLVAQAEQRVGPVDVLVNNAAIFERAGWLTMGTEDFDRHMQVNARTVYLLSLAAGRRMRKRHQAHPDYQGLIVNMACVGARHPYIGYIGYSASKAAVVNMTRGFARMLGSAARVNAIAPGPILPAAGHSDAEHEAAVEMTLLKRWGSVEEIAAALGLFVRARYLTGVVLHVDGGRSLL